jgi:amino acid adenylation domain-containing protein
MNNSPRPFALGGDDKGMHLAHALSDGAGVDPTAPAVIAANGGIVTFQGLVDISQRVADGLRDLELGPGDRVGVFLPKSIDAVGAILGVLRAGAAYVPIDPASPPARARLIIEDCGLSALFTTRELAEKLAATAAADFQFPVMMLDYASDGGGLDRGLRDGFRGRRSTAIKGPADLAYILYTSGSTGRPKGVMLSHQNAVSFLDWCSSTFRPTHTDRFSSHAPLHFDLSILDVFLSLRHGATLVLLDPEEAKNPKLLAARIAERRITSWYSAPSILSMLAQFGRLADYDLTALRRILFAGEVFPVRYLRLLKQQLPAPSYHNLYGPTETNVCTSYDIPTEIEPDRTAPYPIGPVCDHLRGRVVDLDGDDVATGAEGELCISGPSVMLGYWARPEETTRAFLPSRDGERWYRTGDIVRLEEPSGYVFVGRRDRMVKRRGYRIELGEVEVGLLTHPAVTEAAVVATSDGDGGVRMKAVLGFGDGPRPSVIDLKAFCATALPAYMVPDEFVLCASLPKTSTDKIDLRRLTEMT